MCANNSSLVSRTVYSILKTSAAFLVALGWMMLATMKLTAMQQTFNKQLSKPNQIWQTDDPNSFLYRIWKDQPPMHCVNTVVISAVDLITKNVRE